MRFSAPEWLIVVPFIAVAGWRWPQLRLANPLRAFCLSLLALLLLQPQFRQLGSGLDLWVLVDRSASAADTIEPRLREWEGLIERSKLRDDRIFYVDYSDNAFVRDEQNNIAFSGSREFTRTGAAIEFALARMSS